jgi:hypothetical protein
VRNGTSRKFDGLDRCVPCARLSQDLSEEGKYISVGKRVAATESQGLPTDRAERTLALR